MKFLFIVFLVAPTILGFIYEPTGDKNNIAVGTWASGFAFALALVLLF